MPSLKFQTDHLILSFPLRDQLVIIMAGYVSQGPEYLHEPRRAPANMQLPGPTDTETGPRQPTLS